MLFYSPILTLISLAAIPVLVLISVMITPVLKSRLDEKFNCGAESQSYLVEAVTGVQTIKSFAIEPSARKKWEGLLARYTTASFKTSILSGNAGAVAQFIQKIADIMILWIGARLVIAGDLTVGQLVAFRMLSGRVSNPVLRLVQMWQDFQQTSISVKRLGDIFNSKPEPSVNSSKMRLPAINGDIRFEKVSFRYNPQSAEVIRNMSFGIRPNTVVGIVGKSGSGKSTISKLVQRLYVPESGKILIDGNDIAMADPNWLRTQIGVVLQENFLFNATIRENIALHNPASSMDEIINAAKIAGAHEFILEMNEGYDTMVGEKGTGLSGGQKQRIAIARAFLKNPPVMVFDEATSALDTKTEKQIQKSLDKLAESRTTLIIAHRLSTIINADRIVVLHNGEIAEMGTHKELMAHGGIYKKLYELSED